jgi:hypothetical protein
MRRPPGELVNRQTAQTKATQRATLATRVRELHRMRGEYQDSRGIVIVETSRNGLVYYRRGDGELLRLCEMAFARRFRKVE